MIYAFHDVAPSSKWHATCVLYYQWAYIIIPSLLEMIICLPRCSPLCKWLATCVLYYQWAYNIIQNLLDMIIIRRKLDPLKGRLGAPRNALFISVLVGYSTRIVRSNVAPHMPNGENAKTTEDQTATFGGVGGTRS